MIYLQGSNSHLFTLVDDEDFENLSKIKWYLSSAGYATSVSHKKGCSYTDVDRNVNIAMHRLLMPGAKLVDHINRTKLDNRKENLRSTDRKINARNCTKASGFAGVSDVVNESGNYRVRLGKKQYGEYKDTKTAALVADEVRRRIWGDTIGQINFPDERLPKGFAIVGLDYGMGKAAKRSKEVGVSWFSPREKWRYIYKGKTIGYYLTEQKAIEAKYHYLKFEHED